MDKNKTKEIFALLFALGSLKLSAIEKRWGKVQDVISGLNDLLKDLPLEIIQTDSEIVLSLSPDTSKQVKDFLNIEKGEELTDSIAQVLTLILYCGPISKAEIDYVRGVNSATTLRKLFSRGLITRQKKGARVFYAPSAELLANMGIASQDELKDKDEFCNHIQKLLNGESE